MTKKKSKLNLLPFLSGLEHMLPGHEGEVRELSFACTNLRSQTQMCKDTFSSVWVHEFIYSKNKNTHPAFLHKPKKPVKKLVKLFSSPSSPPGRV